MFILANASKLCIQKAPYSFKSRRNLLSFNDIHRNELILSNVLSEFWEELDERFGLLEQRAESQEIK